MESYYKIKDEFCIQIKFIDLQDCKLKCELRNKLLGITVESYEQDDITLKQALSACKLISHCLSYTREDIILRFAEQLVNLPGVFACAKSVLDCDDENSLALMAVLLIQKFNRPTSGCGHTSDISADLSIDLPVDEVCACVDIEPFVEALKLSQELAMKAVLNANAWNMLAAAEVLKWTSVFFYLTSNFALRNLLPSGNMYRDNVETTRHVLNDISTVFISYVHYRRSKFLYMS